MENTNQTSPNGSRDKNGLQLILLALYAYLRVSKLGFHGINTRQLLSATPHLLSTRIKNVNGQ